MSVIDTAVAALGGGAPAPAPISDNFDRCVAVTLAYEGGFVDNPADPGGATNFGITARTLAHYLGRDVTTDDVRNMSVDTADAIYRANYWNAARCGELPAGVDLMVFDWGVNSGTATAAKALQNLVGATPDGAIGPLTLAAVASADPLALVNGLAQARMAFLQALSTFAIFGRGWTNRVTGVQATAAGMVGS